MFKRLQYLSRSVSLSQIILGISFQLIPSAIANPILTTSPNNQANAPQESTILSDRPALAAPNSIAPDESVAQPTGVPKSLESLKGIPTSLKSLKTEQDLATPAFESPLAQGNAQDSLPKSAPAQSTSDTAKPADDSSSREKLAKASQNPIASLISVPFQNNFNFGVGPYDRLQYVLNFQPVFPTSLSDDWLLVSRIITPIILQPIGTTASTESTFGLGDLNPSFFVVPKNSSDFTWGVGPVFSLPTATYTPLGTGKWSVGPTGVAVWSPGRWVIGALANQLWSVAGDPSRPDVSQFLIQPFINYNLPDGWYLTSSPIITANWNASSGNQWTVPIGGGFGKIFRIGKQPVNANLAAYWNVAKPEFAADWQLRFQFQLLFPTGG